MFALAILIGIYSYLIFVLGLLGFLYRENIILLTIIYFACSVFYFRKFILSWFQCFKTLKPKKIFIAINKNSFALLLILLIVVQSSINLMGALGPELAFDSLWYHLTLPKIYLESHKIEYIPGGLMYYSAMPQLVEMLYTVSLAISTEVLAKLIHFSFGILTLISLYFLSNKFFTKTISVLIVLIFSSNLVFSWESITSYVDLGRTFFELMALWGFVNWWETKQKKWLIESAVMLGLAISTKILALGSLFIFIPLIVVAYLIEKQNKKTIFTSILVYLGTTLLMAFPWFIYSFVNTGNPVYPLFTSILKPTWNFNMLNPINYIFDIFNIFTRSSDPISPLYIIFLPFSFFFIKKIDKKLLVIALYSILSLIVFYFNPKEGGSRFILPYLPAFSILVGLVVENIKIKQLKIFSIAILLLVSLSSLFYRGAANAKYLPVVLGREIKQDFLSKNLNFSFGDFYDIDGFFNKTIKDKDRVLLYGFHNLYYVNFPFVHESWVKKGDKFNYIATYNSELPKRFSYWNLIYYNNVTKIKVYSLGGQMWHY